MLGVGRIGAVGGSRGGSAAPAVPPDFTLSASTVTTAWGLVTIGDLSPTGAPADAYFMLVESIAVSGDEAGLAVVNG